MLWILAGFMILILLVLFRAIIGPTVIDRLIAINAISSKVSMIILLLAFYRAEYEFVDIAIVFMLCGFVGVLWIIKVLTPSIWHFEVPELNQVDKDGKKGFSND